jgi:CrcB protein
LGQGLVTYLWIALGGAVGTIARYGAYGVAQRAFGEAFPWGTLLVNVSGSFVIGIFMALAGPGGRWPVSPDARLFVTVGICGGYTTFSTFSLQTLNLARGGDYGAALGNIAGSVVLCLAAVWLGFAAGALINQASGRP